MHSLQGALSESLYIYQPAIQVLNQKTGLKSALSIGLGLAYNEMIFAAEAIRGNWSSFYLESFESQGLLREGLIQWLDSPHPSPIYHSSWQWVSHHYQIEPQQIKNFLSRSMEEKRWKIRQILGPDTIFDHKFNCILFDAYSSKTSPKIWTETALSDFLRKVVATPEGLCVFSTYAATGALTRSLKRHGFQVQIRKGFGRKRESTWGFMAGPTEGVPPRG